MTWVSDGDTRIIIYGSGDGFSDLEENFGVKDDNHGKRYSQNKEKYGHNIGAVVL